MIKYDDNCGCEYSGTKIGLISELTVIMKRMVEGGVLNDEDIDLLVKTVRMPMADIQAQNRKSVEEMSEFDKLMMQMFAGINPDELAAMSVED